MPNELKECPNPSCTSKFDPICYHTGGLLQVRCRCGSSGPFKHSEEDAIAAWNALPRKVKWVTYDGTEEKLPPKDTKCCVELVGRHHILKAIAWRYDSGGQLINNEYWQEKGAGLSRIVAGDRWTPWPGEMDNDVGR